MLYVTTPKAWVALCALLAILLAVVVWSVVGEVSTWVRAEGIILSRGGMVVDAVSSTGGRVARILQAVGDHVEAGGVVAETYDAETMERYKGALALVEERLQVLHDLQAAANEENALYEQSVADQRARLESLRRTGEELVENARERLAGLERLADEGLVSQFSVETGAQAVDGAQRSLFDVMRTREQLEADELRRQNQLDAGIADARVQVADGRRRVNELEALIETWRIRTTVAGRVTEIKTQVGAALNPGESVLSIETGETGLDVLIYVASADGKRVEPGMSALVHPNTVSREEFGSMTGTVESLSEFPASLSGIVASLQNEDLATALLGSGPPYPGRVALIPDPSTASGFGWTSPRGATVDVTPGTLAQVEIRTGSQPPAALILPWFQKVLGL